MPYEPLAVNSYEDWVSYIFDHPVTDPAWHWDIDALDWDTEGHPAEVVAYMTALFENPVQVMAGFTDDQLKQGFWFLASADCSSHMFALRDVAVPWENRKQCVQAMVQLFERCFAVRCSPHLSHLDEPGANALNALCYMWFDIVPIHGVPETPTLDNLYAEFLRVLERIIAIPHDACREAAIHGLGEWHYRYPTQTRKILDQWLGQHPDARPELRGYAQNARVGHVQ